MRRVFSVVLAFVVSLMIPFAPVLAEEAVPTISAPELQRLIEDKAPFFLLDVRSEQEYAEGHIAGAVLIPLPVLPDRLSELPKDRKIVVTCRSGRRSATAVQLLKASGLTDAVSLSGGFQAWAAGQDVQKHLACGEKAEGVCDKDKAPAGL